MENWVLTVGCSPNEFPCCQKEWLKYNMLLRSVQSMTEAIERLIKEDYLLFSISIPPQDYLPYLKLIRQLKPVPILVVPSDYNASDKLQAIDLGADGYMEMPKTVEECVATGWALIRRYTELNNNKQERVNTVVNKDIFVCLDFRKVFVRSVEVGLTRIEFDILHLLMSNPKRVFTYEQIFRHVWGDEYFDSSNSLLWNHIKRLRNKLKMELDMPDYIKNVHEIGYAFDHE